MDELVGRLDFVYPLHMRIRWTCVSGVLLAAATMFTIAVTGAHAHARGDQAMTTCAVCTIAHLPAIHAEAAAALRTPPEALLTYRPVREVIEGSFSVPDKKSRAPPV